MATVTAILERVKDILLLKGIRQRVREIKQAYRATQSERRLARLRRQIGHMARSQRIELDEFEGRLTDGPNGYIQYKDLFIRQIYRFNATRPDPRIIDSGSNVGMSIAYFKHRYPLSRIVGFEPDSEIFRILEENVRTSRLKDVQLVKAALGREKGTACFAPDGEAGGQLNPDGASQVRVDRLSAYLAEPVDFLKLNIEGAELEVLEEIAQSGRLSNVREMVIEYHGWPNGEQRLGDILNLLNQHGFRYLLHDFDSETCGSSKPPFRWTPETTWFCLIYAIQASAAVQQKAA